MSSRPANTPRTTAPARPGGSPQPAAPPERRGLDLGTLVVAAAASVIAATVVSRFWQAGTVMATAMTPVVVALIKEALDRPARHVSSIASRAVPPPLVRGARAEVEPPAEEHAPAPPLAPDPRFTEMRVYRGERATGRHWKLAVATGLLAFVIAVAFITLPELVAGRSVVSGSHHTTVFGGQRRPSTTTSKPAEKKTTTDESKTITGVAPQDTTTQPDTTTTAPDGQPAPVAPQGQTQSTAPTQPAPTTTQPPAQTQPPPTTTP